MGSIYLNSSISSSLKMEQPIERCNMKKHIKVRDLDQYEKNEETIESLVSLNTKNLFGVFFIALKIRRINRQIEKTKKAKMLCSTL